MRSTPGSPVDFTLVVQENLSDSYDLSKLLLAKAGFDGTLQLLTSGWERVLGFRREEFRGKTLLQLLWSDRGAAAAAAAAILNLLDMAPVELRLRCRDGLAKCFRLHRNYDVHERMMYIVAEEIAASEAPALKEKARGGGAATGLGVPPVSGQGRAPGNLGPSS